MSRLYNCKLGGKRILVLEMVSGEDERNLQMLREFYKVLKPGGKLYGNFPSFFFGQL